MDNVQKSLLAIVLGLVLLLAFTQLSNRKAIANKKSSKYYRPTYLILGAIGSGKTSLFYRLTQPNEGFASTISSLEPNVSLIALPFSNSSIQKKYQLIDYPGHLKHSQLLRKLISEDITVENVKGIVYMIDSSSASLGQDSKVTAIAKDLFQLLSTTEKVSNGVDILFAVNKQDLFDSRPVHKVRQLLEQELAKLIANEISGKGGVQGKSGIDNDDVEDDGTGIRKDESVREFWKAAVGSRPFKFDLLEGNTEFIGGSVLKGAIDNWENWFDERAVNYGGI